MIECCNQIIVPNDELLVKVVYDIATKYDAYKEIFDSNIELLFKSLRAHIDCVPIDGWLPKDVDLITLESVESFLLDAISLKYECLAVDIVELAENLELNEFLIDSKVLDNLSFENQWLLRQIIGKGEYI